LAQARASNDANTAFYGAWNAYRADIQITSPLPLHRQPKTNHYPMNTAQGFVMDRQLATWLLPPQHQ
jgi:DICT domain-containing protein